MKCKMAIRFCLFILFLGVHSCCKVEFSEGLTSEQMILTTDWSQRSFGLSLPDNYVVEINSQTYTYMEPTAILPKMPAGTYSILVYNTPESIRINGSTAKVEKAGDFIESNPGWLFTSVLDVVYQENVEKFICTVMQQQVRQLNIELRFKDGGIEQVQSVAVSLSGIASELDFKTNILKGNGSIYPVYVLESNKYIASAGLLGINNEKQIFKLSMIFKNGGVQDFHADLSTKLLAFNKNKKDPFTLVANIRIEDDVNGIHAEITDWETIYDEIIIN